MTSTVDTPVPDSFPVTTAALIEQSAMLLQPYFPLFLIVLILLLIVANWLAGIEIAMFSLTPTQINQLKTSSIKSDQRIHKLLEKPYRLLATLLLMSSITFAAIITLVFIGLISLSNLLPGLWTTILLTLFVSTVLILSFTELIPGTIYSRNPLRAARKSAMISGIFTTLFTPFTSLFLNPVRLFERRMNRWGLNLSVEEISEAMEMNTQGSEMDDESRMLKGIIKFGDTDTSEIMKSRVDVTAVSESASFTEVINAFVDSGYSRLPVYHESLDHITGILYVKDLLPYLASPQPNEWKTLIRAPFLVPERKKIGDLLADFREKKIHLAVVVDEYGGTAGIVTLEDILEEIVGDISDETDQEADEVFYQVLDADHFIFDGKILINDFCRILDIPNNTFDDIRGEADTLAGLILEAEGRFPQKGEQLIILGYLLEIEAVENRRIKRIKVTKPTE